MIYNFAIAQLTTGGFLMPALIAVGVMLILLLAATYAIYQKAFYSPHRHQNEIYSIPSGEQYQPHAEHLLSCIRRFDEMPCEYVEITSHDGLKLTGRYYHVQDGVPLAIGFHGYRSTAIRDFCGGGVTCIEEGMNLLIIDQRGQGASDGHTITFGVKERFDCLDWINYALNRFGSDTQIMLYGGSMGSATVLLASGLDMPKNVCGIIADCPYSSAKEIICKVCRDMKIPDRLAYPFIWLSAQLFGRFNLSAGNAAKAVKNANVPILIIHGEDDRFVPCEMSRKLHAANPDVITLETFPDAGHGISYVIDPVRYRKLVSGFIHKLFGEF